MIPSLRHKFNAEWKPAKYARMLAYLADLFGEPPPFRHSETPVFLPEPLVQAASKAGEEILAQLFENPDYLPRARAAIPKHYRTPNEAAVPLFVQADFGLDAARNLHLVEIQGFPSLYGYQPVLSDAYCKAYELPDDVRALPGGLNRAEYERLLREAIVGSHDPREVVLLEIDPEHQKTRHDFVATQRMLNIGIADARTIQRRGNKLFYNNGTPVRRIYNRVIADEVERRGLELPFRFTDDLDVEWAGHPNWFFLLSKYSLPFLKHATVPETVFLSDAGVVGNPSDYVLKPLYSFAGVGVIVGPTQEQIAAIPERDRSDYILQRRIDFAPCIETPEGPTKIEIRVMYIWTDRLRPVNLIIRMGRGAQMGVDFNKGLGWVGASAAFIQ